MLFSEIPITRTSITKYTHAFLFNEETQMQIAGRRRMAVSSVKYVNNKVLDLHILEEIPVFESSKIISVGCA